MLIPRGVWITRHTELFHPKLMMGQTDSDSHKLTAMNDPVETTPMMGQTVVDSDSYDSDPDPDEGYYDLIAGFFGEVDEFELQETEYYKVCRDQVGVRFPFPAYPAIMFGADGITQSMIWDIAEAKHGIYLGRDGITKNVSCPAYKDWWYTPDPNSAFMLLINGNIERANSLVIATESSRRNTLCTHVL